MPTFGFSAFLKILSLNPKPQRREVRSRLSPSEGGYDFHRSLRLRIHRMMVEGEDLDSLVEEAATLGNPAERRSLESGLRQLEAWRAANPGRVIDFPPTLYTSPGGRFKVSFVPDFGYLMADQGVAIHVWNTGTVKLSPRMAYVALAMVASSYSDELRPADLAVLSLPDNRLYRLSDVADQSRLAGIVAVNLDRLFGDVSDEATAPLPPPESRPGSTIR